MFSGCTVCLGGLLCILSGCLCLTLSGLNGMLVLVTVGRLCQCFSSVYFVVILATYVTVVISKRDRVVFVIVT